MEEQAKVKPSSYRLHPEVKHMLRRMSEMTGYPQNTIVQMAIREYWTARRDREMLSARRDDGD